MKTVPSCPRRASGHPLDEFRQIQFGPDITTALSVLENEEGKYSSDAPVEMIGIISAVRNRRTKQNDLMKYITLEDLTGSIECIVFPNAVKAYDALLEKDKLVRVKGDLDITEDQPPKVRVRAVEPLRKQTAKLYISLSTRDASKLTAIKQVLRGASGTAEIYVYFADENKASKARATIDPRDKRIGVLKDMLGEQNIRMVIK